MGQHKKYLFTPDMQEAIKAAMQDKRATLRKLHATDPRFADISYGAVNREATRLKYFSRNARTSRTNSRDWTQEETEYAAEAYMNNRSVASISKAMYRRGWKRSPAAIHTRMMVLHLRRDMGQHVSMQQLATELGVAVNTVKRWAERLGLKVWYGPSGDDRYTTYGALRNWIAEHPYEFATTVKDVDLFWLIGLLCPTTAGDTKDYATDDDSGAWLNGEAVRDVAAAD